jgi:hypothetical protein
MPWIAIIGLIDVLYSVSFTFPSESSPEHLAHEEPERALVRVRSFAIGGIGSVTIVPMECAREPEGRGPPFLPDAIAITGLP